MLREVTTPTEVVDHRKLVNTTKYRILARIDKTLARKSEDIPLLTLDSSKPPLHLQ